MAHHYFPHTEADVKAMLDVCGVESVMELYSDVPEQLRLKKSYDLPASLSEQEVKEWFESVNSKNIPLVCFAGCGAYDHYSPAVVGALASRSEYLTAYTPYQPEISQGTLQYIFEYQSMMTELTGLPVSNASLYDGATATAEAMIMAVNAARRRRRVLVSETIDPKVLSVVNTYAKFQGIAVEVIPAKDGVTDRDSMRLMLESGDVAAVIVASPNYYGILEDYDGWAEEIHAAKALMIMNCPALPLGVIKTPGEWGADIAVGEAQSLGMPLGFGGPYLGYMCCTEALMRKMPGRIVGATMDEKGQRVFVLTLQAREQHIRREKATSNICSNQGIMTLYAGIYMSLMGADGLIEVNRLSTNAAHYLAERLSRTGKMSLTYPDKPFLNEFSMMMAHPLTTDVLLDALQREGILGGVAVDESEIIIACTEKRSAEQIDKYVSIVESLS